MKLEAFTSGEYKQQYQYRSFSPALINHGWSWDDGRVNTLLEQATKALGELIAFSLVMKWKVLDCIPYYTFCFESIISDVVLYFLRCSPHVAIARKKSLRT